MADVFISFAPEDRAWVGVFAGALTAAGFDVLWDLAPSLGQSTQRDVDQELTDAKAVIAVWSTASRNSNWVRDVAQEAFDRGVLLPVLKDVDRPPLGFRQLRCADLRSWTAGPAGLEEVIGQLRGRVGAAIAPEMPPARSQDVSEPSAGDELDFERSTIVMKSEVDEASGHRPTQPSVGGLSGPPTGGVSGIPSVSEKVVSARLRGGGPGDLRQGDEVGQYRIVRRLGAGGFGAVYEAANIHNEDERVALKLLLPDVAASERFAQLLKLEANALLRLKHPAVVQYRVFGRIADTDQFYLVTEFVPGPTLRDWRRSNTPSLDDIRSVAVRLASGLAAAHKRGIVHRDLAPDNVIVTQGDLSEATLIDFGIARMGEGDALGGAFAGKFSYAAPEQFAFDTTRLGPSIDIYAFGLLMAAFARGKPLDMGRDVEAAKAKRLGVPPLEDIPPPLALVLTQILQPDPADRPVDMDAVARLFEVMSDAPPDLPPLIPVTDAPPSALVEAELAIAEPSVAPVAEIELPDEAEAADEADPAPVPQADAAEPYETEAVEAAETDTGPALIEASEPYIEADANTRRSPLASIAQFVGLAAVGAAVVFFVLPSGDKGGGETTPALETPAATPSPTITPTPDVTPLPTPSIAPTPTATPSPSATPTPEPTPSPTPAVTPAPTPEPTPSATPSPTPEATPTPTPEAPLASGKIESVPRGTKVQAQNGKAYGSQNRDGRIVYVVRRPTHLTVIGGGKDQLIDRDMKKGDSYRLPNRGDLAVSTDDAGALDVILDDKYIGRAGPDGSRLAGLRVTPEAYGGPAVLPTPTPTPRPTPTAEPTPPPNDNPPQPVASGNVSAQALSMLNRFRAQNGVGQVSGSEALDQVAQSLADNNARVGKNQNPSGSALLQMLIQSGYGNAGANQVSARNRGSVSDAMSFWQGRGDLSAALLSPNAAAMGLGVAESGGSRFWVIVVAQPPR